MTAAARAPTSSPMIAQKNMSSTWSRFTARPRCFTCSMNIRYVTANATRYMRPYHRMGRPGMISGRIHEGNGMLASMEASTRARRDARRLSRPSIEEPGLRRKGEHGQGGEEHRESRS